MSSKGSAFAAAPPASQPLPRAYKDYLTPALHRRFTYATGAVLFLCWAEATLMSNAGWFWSWFPLSITGLRSLMLFIPCLCICILRVANMHIGEAASTSPFETLVQKLVGKAWRTSAVTLFWYTATAWLFGEVYIWSKGQKAGLGWVDYGRAYERPRLNENPVYLRSLLLILASVQTSLHILWDYDCVMTKDIPQLATETSETTSWQIPVALKKLQGQTKHILQLPLNMALISVLLSFAVYFVLFRSLTWNFYHWIAQLLVSQLPPNAGPIGLNGALRLLWQSMTACYLLGLLWTVSNALFTIYVEMAPLKKHCPLTDEIKDARGVVISRSKDPNGSLICGLQARNTISQGFAFWELDQICENFPDRRRTIFTEVERIDRPQALHSTWSAISSACLNQIVAIGRRIASAEKPVPTRQEIEQLEQQRRYDAQMAESRDPLGLPRIANVSVKDDPNVVLHSKSHEFTATAGDTMKRLGQHPGSANAVTAWAGRAVQARADEALPKEWRSRFAADNVGRSVNEYLLQFVSSSFGTPFRQTFKRRVSAVIFGVPYSGEANIIHATRALTKLTIESLREDNYGQVAKDVPNIVRTFSFAIVNTQRFVHGLKPHWTDVDLGGNREVREVKELITELKGGLEQILLAFNEYAGAIGLSQKELREAKEAVGKGTQMIKV